MSKTIKVGDELVFRSGGIIDRVEIIRVDKVTPSGRIYAGKYQLNPDLRIRGRRDGWYGPFHGELLSAKEMAELKREEKEKRIRASVIHKIGETNWRELPTKTLLAVWKSIEAATELEGTR